MNYFSPFTTSHKVNFPWKKYTFIVNNWFPAFAGFTGYPVTRVPQTIALHWFKVIFMLGLICFVVGKVLL